MCPRCSTTRPAACAPPPPPVEAPPPVATPQEEAPRATFTSQVGGMNQEAVERAFADFQTSVIHCLERGEHEGLGGELTLHLRVALDGRTRWAHIDRSTMGSRDVERCIMAEAEARRWPKPKGGEGKADHTYVVDPAVAVEVWEAKRLRPAMPAIVREVAKCLEGRRDRFQATIYFGRDGRVMSAGVASPRRSTRLPMRTVAAAGKSQVLK